MASKFNTSAQKIHVGQIYGGYTVLEVRSPSSLCQCVCGNQRLIRNSHMVAGRVGKCHGCANKRIRPGRRTLDSLLSKERYQYLSAKVRNAIDRCTRESHKHWKHYGGRGIKVCQEWIDDPTKFLEYLLALDGHDNTDLVIDRMNNDGNYEPGNLKFSTRSESQRNKGKYRSHNGSVSDVGV